MTVGQYDIKAYVYAHVLFDELDLDFENVWKTRPTCCFYISQLVRHPGHVQLKTDVTIPWRAAWTRDLVLYVTVTDRQVDA